MNKCLLSAVSGLILAMVCTGCNNVRALGRVNGVELTKVSTRGFFTPATTTVLAHSPETPGQVEVVTSVGGPSALGTVANAGGLVGAAALLRPARSTVNNESGSGSSSTASGSGNATGGTGNQKVPPGHINNPSNNN